MLLHAWLRALSARQWGDVWRLGWQLAQSPAVLLAVSALAAKVLGLIRDNLFAATFPDSGITDLIYVAFRIPDFFFYLLISGTIATLMLPRLAAGGPQHEQPFFQSFFWGTLVLFGSTSVLCALAAPWLTQLFAAGISSSLHPPITHLSQLLFGSTFLLALSSVCAAWLQHRQQFWSLALAPLLYTGGICLWLAIFGDQWGLRTIGWGALAGALCHLGVNLFAAQRTRLSLRWQWAQPSHLWRQFWPDFWRRVANSSCFQVNQTIDLIIAGALVAGSVTAFQLGSTLGHMLMSIVGYSIAQALFPRLTHLRGQPHAQSSALWRAVGVVFVLTVPIALLCALFSGPLVGLIFPALSPEVSTLTQIVFFWTVLSLPCACAIPSLSRAFLANDDTRTPLMINIFSLTLATLIAAVLALRVLPPATAVLGLAIGNVITNVTSCLLFAGVWHHRHRRPTASRV